MIRRHVTPSLLISLLALFVATSGASYAALQIPKNSVGTKQLTKNAVTSKKVKDGSLLAKDFKSGQLPQGPQGPQGPAGPAGTTPAFRVQDTSVLALTNATQSIVSIDLPAGSYVVTSRVNFFVSGPDGKVLCSLGTDELGTDTVQMAPVAPVLPLSQTATVTLASPGAVQLNCLQQAGAVSAAQRSLTAIKVSSIN